MVGNIDVAGNSDVYLLRTDASGDTLWTSKYGGTEVELGQSIQATTDGGWMLAGETSSFGAGWRDFYLVRIAPDLGFHDGEQVTCPMTLRSGVSSPCRRTARISYQLGRSSRVRVTILDLLGSEVTTLVNREEPAGEHELTWDGRDDSGARVPAGTYFVRVETEMGSATSGLVFMR